ncbi:MAG: DUF397 domain-containing protein [Pseudonocardia sp.]|nr:DUF397 domain-containing protein [Pseudonocardia sp.]
MKIKLDTGYTISSHCFNGSCVAVIPTDDGRFSVADTKNSDSDPLVYTREEWRSFILGVKGGEFDFDVLADSPIGSQA